MNITRAECNAKVAKLLYPEADKVLEMTDFAIAFSSTGKLSDNTFDITLYKRVCIYTDIDQCEQAVLIMMRKLNMNLLLYSDGDSVHEQLLTFIERFLIHI